MGTRSLLLLGEESPVSEAEFKTLQEAIQQLDPQLRAWVRQRIGPALARRLDVGDVLQDAYKKALEEWPKQPRWKLSVADWLRRKVKDTLRDLCRYHFAQIRDVTRESPLPENSDVQKQPVFHDPGTSPSSALGREDLVQLFRDTLKMLPDNDQAILGKLYLQRRSLQEAAEELGLGEGTARQRKARALRRLAALWKQLHGLEGYEP
jgi:RNA polymerase sigma-70 factor (ECF subfamily)